MGICAVVNKFYRNNLNIASLQISIEDGICGYIEVTWK